MNSSIDYISRTYTCTRSRSRARMYMPQNVKRGRLINNSRGTLLCSGNSRGPMLYIPHQCALFNFHDWIRFSFFSWSPHNILLSLRWFVGRQHSELVQNGSISRSWCPHQHAEHTGQPSDTQRPPEHREQLNYHKRGGFIAATLLLQPQRIPWSLTPAPPQTNPCRLGSSWTVSVTRVSVSNHTYTIIPTNTPIPTNRDCPIILPIIS